MAMQYVDFYTKNGAEHGLKLLRNVGKKGYIQQLTSCRYQLRIMDNLPGLAESVVQAIKIGTITDHGEVVTRKR